MLHVIFQLSSWRWIIHPNNFSGGVEWAYLILGQVARDSTHDFLPSSYRTINNFQVVLEKSISTCHHQLYSSPSSSSSSLCFFFSLLLLLLPFAFSPSVSHPHLPPCIFLSPYLFGTLMKNGSTIFIKTLKQPSKIFKRMSFMGDWQYYM